MKLSFFQYLILMDLVSGSFVLGSTQNDAELARRLQAEENSGGYYRSSIKEQILQQQLDLYQRRVATLQNKVEQGYRSNQVLQERINYLQAVKELQKWQEMIKDLRAPSQMPENYLADASPEQLKCIISRLQLALAESRLQFAQLQAELKEKSEKQFTFVPTGLDIEPALVDDTLPTQNPGAKNNSSLENIDE